MSIGDLYYLKDCKEFIVLIIAYDLSINTLCGTFVQYYCLSSKHIHKCTVIHAFKQHYDFLC